MKHSALHGRSVEDITLSVERDILSLHISALDLDLPTHARPIWEEISRDEYSQSVKLPQGIDASSIQARLIDHELILNLPKLTPVKHQISISNAA